ncbi:hypothetical protein Tco_0483310, partial [Tanacetum coccineum]
ESSKTNAGEEDTGATEAINGGKSLAAETNDPNVPCALD